MLRNLLFIIVLLLVSLAASRVAENPGQMSMEWFGYRIQTSAAFMLVATLTLALLTWLALKFLDMLVTAPRRIGKARTSLQQEKGLAALTEAFVALGDNDTTTATKYITQAEKFLPDPTLPRLLNLQLARQQGDEEKLREQFQSLQDSEQTRPLALRGLIEEARRSDRMTEALTRVEELLKLRPKHIPTLVLAADIFSYHRRWQEALQLIADARKRLTLSSQQARRLSALVYVEQAQIMLKENNRSSAIELLKEATSKDPSVTTAAILLADNYLQNDKISDATNVLRKAWAAQPHPELAALIEKTLVALPPEKRLKKIQDILKPHADTQEGLLATAKSAIAAKDWALARQCLKTASGRQETVTLCKLMAELEQQEGSEPAKANYWLDRATSATPDSVWRCNSCGHQPAAWSAHCPECTHFDSVHWQPPQYAVYQLTK